MIERPKPLTVGKLRELLAGLDPELPIYTHANNQDANDNMRVELAEDGWFRVDSGADFGKPPTLGVRIGNMGDDRRRGQLLFDMWQAPGQ